MQCAVYEGIKNIGFPRIRIVKIATYVLEKETQKCSVTIHIVGDRKIRSLNRVHRGYDKTTDVLSFAPHTDRSPYFFKEEQGDIFINPRQIKRQAKRFSVPYSEEFARMLVHGLLHLCGYDHVLSVEAQNMFHKQELYLQAILHKMQSIPF